MSSAVMMFRCCVMPQHSHQTTTRTRPRIDRSTIGMPTNFQHTGHIGSSDVGGASGGSQVDAAGMQTKGGYSETTAFPSHLKLVDLTEVKLS